MKQLFASRLWILLAGMVGLGALVYLAAGLPAMEFQQPIPVRLPELTAREVVGGAFAAVRASSAWEQTLFVVLAVAFLLLMAAVLPPELRKRLLLMALRLVLVVLMVAYLVEHYQPPPPQEQAPGTGGVSPSTGLDFSVPAFIPPQVPPAFSFIASFLIILAVMGAVYLWWRARALGAQTSPVDQIARIARQTLAELASGSDLDNAIVQCYVRMGETLVHERNLQRRSGMTPAEFASRLERVGLPREPVWRLTHLFEEVRYGRKQASHAQVSEAIDCLQAILKACQGAA